MKIKISWLPILSLACLLFARFVQAAPIAPNSGASLCGALAPADFLGVGITNAAPPKANVTESSGAYCVYAGKSSATGGIELDVFYPAGANPAEVKASQETAIGELSSVLKPIALPGADEALWSANAVSGGPPFATIVVRRSNLLFVLGIPSGKNSQAQLLKLAEVALKRF